ncbi:gamma-glutamyltranspeptidase [Providencia alcalifaciens]|nr:gamma-glutamyltranspeptidase [Providencia alcalifaciens]
MSLFFNLPHLCGLGGDAIIIKKNKGEISIINGTGKTGTYQNRISYEEKGLSTIPKRGIYCTMVYGAPYAFETLVKEADVDLVRMIETLIKNDFDKGFINIPCFEFLFKKAKLEFSQATKLKEWGELFYGGKHVNNSFINMMKRVSQVGFNDFYKGRLANEVYNQIDRYDNRLYSESDFTHFSPKLQ